MSEPAEVAWLICPECKQGKHRNCTDQAWHPALDRLVACECGHERDTCMRGTPSCSRLNEYHKECETW